MFDLDGTVLDNGDDLTPRTAHALEHAHASGCTVAVCSGRAASIVPASIKELPFVDYLITSNGACIRRVADAAILRYACLNRHTVLDVLSATRGKKAALTVFFKDYAVFELKGLSYLRAGTQPFHWKGHKELFEMRKGIHPVFSVRRALRRTQLPIEKMGCNFKSGTNCEAVLRILRAQSDATVVRALGNELEITAHGISKGSSIGVLCNLLSIDPHEVVAFGDSGNDLSMKENAGCFVAMGNATPAVKAAADFITGTVGDDGVAQWLEHYWEA